METSITVKNLNQVLARLHDLPTAFTKKIVQKGMIEAGKAINSAAKRNLNATRLGKSRTNYAAYANNAFVVNQIKRRNDEEVGGVKVGIIGGNQSGNLYGVYKLRWIQWGTKNRRAVHRRKDDSGGYVVKTGTTRKTDFFYSAVRSTQNKAFEIISQSVQASLKEYWNK